MAPGCVRGDEDRSYGMGLMVVNPEENRHPHVTQWPQPKDIAGHHREELPGVPRKGGPEILASNTPSTQSSTATWPQEIM